VNDVEIGGRALAVLMIAGLLSGIASVLAFRHWSDAAKLRAATNVMLAHLMEFRLFADEPALIIRAQRDLLAANARLLRLSLAPLLLTSIPLAIILATAGAYFEHAPLRAGQPAVVTAHTSHGLPLIQLELPEGFALDSLPVRIPSLGETSWRIRAIQPASGSLQLRVNSRVFTKTISAAPGLQWISGQRSASVLGYLAHPQERPFSNRTLDWVRIQYPAASLLGLHWLVWFSIAACSGGLLSTLGDLP
jgi:hypothetical protein